MLKVMRIWQKLYDPEKERLLIPFVLGRGPANSSIVIYGVPCRSKIYACNLVTYHLLFHYSSLP